METFCKPPHIVTDHLRLAHTGNSLGPPAALLYMSTTASAMTLHNCLSYTGGRVINQADVPSSAKHPAYSTLGRSSLRFTWLPCSQSVTAATNARYYLLMVPLCTARLLSLRRWATVCSHKDGCGEVVFYSYIPVLMYCHVAAMVSRV